LIEGGRDEAADRRALQQIWLRMKVICGKLVLEAQTMTQTIESIRSEMKRVLNEAAKSGERAYQLAATLLDMDMTPAKIIAAVKRVEPSMNRAINYRDGAITGAADSDQFPSQRSKTGEALGAC
jgi:hypothetical protein